MHIQICTYKYTKYKYTKTHTNTWRRVVRRRHILVRPRRLTIRPKEASHTRPQSRQSARIWELRCPFLRQKVSRGGMVTVSCKKLHYYYVIQSMLTAVEITILPWARIDITLNTFADPMAWGWNVPHRPYAPFLLSPFVSHSLCFFVNNNRDKGIRQTLLSW